MERGTEADVDLGSFYYFYAIDGIFRVHATNIDRARHELEEYLTKPVTRSFTEEDPESHSYRDIPYSVILFGDHDYRLDFEPVSIPYDQEKHRHHQILLHKGYPLAKVALLEVLKITTEDNSLVTDEPETLSFDPNQFTLF